MFIVYIIKSNLQKYSELAMSLKNGLISLLHFSLDCSIQYQ